ASAPRAPAGDRRIIGMAAGDSKVRAILAAMRGGLINGLFTSEATAEKILSL
ncbi:MAG: sugar-binding transcriptional regulator, partial [Rhodobacteraceae bacterium]|nr:sugar-binding transcriptional regulator [Paracoccaceae bacterium]